MTKTVMAVESSENLRCEVAAAAIEVPDSREVDELEVAHELVRQARVALTGASGLLKVMTKEAVLSDACGNIDINVPRDRARTFEPQPSTSARGG
jgi:putative transposase